MPPNSLEEMRRKHMTEGHADKGLGTARARTCWDEGRMLLQLRTGESLLVVQDAGTEDRVGTVAFFKGLSLW